jgi:hypothetical protein
MTSPSSRPIQLFCRILEASDRAFSILIDDTDVVDDLKGEIVKKSPHTFADVDAFHLRLWKVQWQFNVQL